MVVAAVEEERGTLLESTDSSEAEQGSTDSSEAESSVLSPSEDEWEDLSQADSWSSMEVAVDAAAVASAAEEATAAEHLDSVRIRDITLTERRQAAQEGLRRASLLPGGQGGRGEMEAGGRPLSFDRGK